LANFDFISEEDFRSSLEQDYRELIAAMEARAWKAAHVLAGSIVEAVLIDYLMWSGYQKRSSSDPLRMSLAQIISVCRQENILSEKTEHLSHAIRSYRNLIHPGRSIRLGETATENGAKIAQALAEIIIEEIAAVKKKNYGYTAQQVINKLERDSTAKAILSHLVNDMNDYEKERLLLYLVPERYHGLRSLSTTSTNDEDTLRVLKECFHLVFDLASEETKRKVCKNFIKVLKEESSDVEWRYDLFKGKYLQYFSSDDVSLVKKHFFSVFTAPITDELLDAVDGMGVFLNSEDVVVFITAFINSIATYSYVYENQRHSDKDINDVIVVFCVEYYRMPEECQHVVINTLKRRYKYFCDQGRDDVAKAFKQLYDGLWLPEDSGLENIEDSHSPKLEESGLGDLEGDAFR